MSFLNLLGEDTSIEHHKNCCYDCRAVRLGWSQEVQSWRRIAIGSWVITIAVLVACGFVILRWG